MQGDTPFARLPDRIELTAGEAGPLAYTYEFIEFVPNERLVMGTAQGPFPMETTYTWAPAGQDRTRMTLRNRGEPSDFSKLAAPFLARAMRRANRKDLASLRRILHDG
jgi:hypothetical protein